MGYEAKENNVTHRTNNVCYVTYTRAASSAEVQDLLSRFNKNFLHTTQNTCCQLTPEGIPYAILDLRVVNAAFDGYPLLAINTFSRNEILCNKEMVFPFGDENTGMPMRLKDDLRTTPGAAPRATTTSTTAPTATTATSTTSSTAETSATSTT